MRLDKIDTFLTQLHSNPSPEKRAVVILQLFDFSTQRALFRAEKLRKALNAHKTRGTRAQQLAVNPDSTSLKQRTPVIAECLDFSLKAPAVCMKECRKTVKAHEAADMASQEALIKPYNVDAYGLIASTALCLPDASGGYRVIAQAPVKALMALGAMAAFIAYVHRPTGEGDTAVRTVGGALLACDTAGRAAEALFKQLYKLPVCLSCRRLKSLFCLLKSKYALFAPEKERIGA